MTPLALILAVGGSGSSGYGGGGGGSFGGGGGGSFGGGSSFGGGGYVGGGGASVGGSGLFVVIMVIVLIVVVSGIVTRMGVARARRQREARVEQVRLASHEAAEDDAYFAADVVEREARDLFVAVQHAWDARDVATLARIAGPDLMVEWRRRLEDFARKGWHNRVALREEPLVQYVGLVNREDDAEDRVVVRVEATLDDWVVTEYGQTVLRDGQRSPTTTLAEYWTLARDGDAPDGSGGGRWVLQSIEQLGEGDHQLTSAIVASPWGDTARIGGEATLEVAAADTPLPGYTTADLVDPDFAADARAAALDLSLADARFGPDVILACVSRAVEAWVEAVDGPDAALQALADPPAVRALLHPGDDRPDPRTRLVVRGVHVEQIAVQALEPSPEPARVTVAVTARGRRYVEDRDTVEVLSGSRDEERTFTDFWILALTGDATMPWRLVGTA